MRIESFKLLATMLTSSSPVTGVSEFNQFMLGTDIRNLSLSPRQTQIVNLVIKSYSVAEIADHLGVTSGEIRRQMKCVLRKVKGLQYISAINFLGLTEKDSKQHFKES